MGISIFLYLSDIYEDNCFNMNVSFDCGLSEIYKAIFFFCCICIIYYSYIIRYYDERLNNLNAKQNVLSNILDNSKDVMFVTPCGFPNEG